MNRFSMLIVCTLLAIAAAGFATAQDTENRILGIDSQPEHSILADSAPIDATLDSGTHSYRSFIKQTRISDRSKVYPDADIVSFSYETNAPQAGRMRPVIFMFNGGPGSSSIWLHMTGFGPGKTSADLLSQHADSVPLSRAPNPGFLIDVADLVFVDPVGTGLSRVTASEVETAFRDIRVDARAMCRFVQNWLQGEDRLGAPVYILGVSYSTLRAAGMASHPSCRDFRRNLHGLIFVSGLLDLRMRHAQDLMGPVSRYPSIAAVAWARGHVDRSLWPNGLRAFLAAMEDYSDTTLAPALAQSHRLSTDETLDIVYTLHTQIGLSPPSGEIVTVAAAVRHAQRQVDGAKRACIYDARFDCSGHIGPHPLLSLTRFGAHLERELAAQAQASWDYALDTDAYMVMRGNNFRANWDYRFHKSAELGSGTDMAETVVNSLPPPPKKSPVSDIPLLRHMVRPFTQSLQPQRTQTRIMVASGIHDFATPYYAMELALLRAGLTAEQFEMHLYEGGHMMYVDEETGHQLAADIRSFIRGAETPS